MPCAAVHIERKATQRINIHIARTGDAHQPGYAHGDGFGCRAHVAVGQRHIQIARAGDVPRTSGSFGVRPRVEEVTRDVQRYVAAGGEDARAEVAVSLGDRD